MPTTLVNQDAQTKPVAPGKFQNTLLSKVELVKRANAMKSEGQSWTPTLKELSTYNYPTWGFFDTPTPSDGSKIDHKTLIDEEATFCVDNFASGMTSGFTSPSRPWFELFIENEQLMAVSRVKIWLDDVRNKMLDIYQKSNAYTILTRMYGELAVFSTACAFIEEDLKNTIHLTNFTAGEYYLGCDQKGRINAFYRIYWMQAGQMVKQFGIENVSAVVQAEYQGNQSEKWHIVNHLIEENDSRIPFLKDYANMAYRSVYWENGSQENSYLRIGGYEEFPLLTPRWDTTTNSDAYGKGGPGWKSLGSVKELQKKVKNLLIGLDKTTNPPLQKDSSVVEVNTMPGGISTFSAQSPNAGVKPTYQVDLKLAELDLSIEKTKQKIRKFYFTDLFLMMIQAEQQGQPITAYEVAEKQSEKLSVLGPLLERWQGDDFIKALIERTFNIGMRNSGYRSNGEWFGVFPEPPQELRDMEIKIRYTSILAQAQKMQGIVAIDQWSNGVIQDAAIDPKALDILNFDEKNKLKADMLGVPSKVVNSPEVMAAARKARQKLAAEADAQKKMLIMAEAGKKGAGAVKEMSQAPMGTNSALDTTLESIKGAQPK